MIYRGRVIFPDFEISSFQLKVSFHIYRMANEQGGYAVTFDFRALQCNQISQLLANNKVKTRNN